MIVFVFGGDEGVVVVGEGGGGRGLFMNITNGILRLLKTVLKRTPFFRFFGH